MKFTAREFRDALGLFPTGVTVVTARGANGSYIGITASSFTSVSLDPALVSVNLARSLHSLPRFLEAESFNINVLTADQSHVAERFARAGVDKWAEAGPDVPENQDPILVPNLAVFQCVRHASHEAGDHVIVLGRVLNFTIGDERAPLVFYRGRFCVVGNVIERCIGGT